MTLNGVMTVFLHYFSEFAYLPGVLRKSSRSLSHLLLYSVYVVRILRVLSFIRKVPTASGESNSMYDVPAFRSPACLYIFLHVFISKY